MESTSTPSTAERLQEIEAKLTLSEDMLDQLNRAVYRQQQLIERLQQELRALEEVVAAGGGEPADPTGPRDELPPHY